MVHKLVDMGIKDERVLQAMLLVPRHLFVEEALVYSAYDHVALPIGLGQTISQPYSVARMTELLLPTTGQIPHKILEIGSGCGYQTAVLAALKVKQIISIERLELLSEQAKKNLAKVDPKNNVRFLCADGYQGLKNQAPFDGIIVTAAPKEVPAALLNQLAVGGKLVIPLGEENEQYLWVIEKREQGFLESCMEKACFVPLINSTI
ncbi:protein-L-isoaspartate(D-aspartate) O-methyltransferase [Neisseria sp. Ec49-e6-T10]|uniref:protein-L-isoaspartate(D-aspartate) O-methyltransferase n=1 Tax=Neisseria sp. Ec49-e6-T10 TaxID=3140744 RepID=UPI003EBC49BD